MIFRSLLVLEALTSYQKKSFQIFLPLISLKMQEEGWLSAKLS